MPARRFDRTRMRSVRRAAEISQSDVASALGVADSTVAGWELGSSTPDQEKLSALAQVLKQPVDSLFPRDGLPDLTDLRCDAGLHRYEMAAVIGTKSDGPVAGAEQGVRRLKDKYLPSLAEAYGVTVDEVRRAQERSMAKLAARKYSGRPLSFPRPRSPLVRWPGRSPCCSNARIPRERRQGTRRSPRP